MSDTTEKLCGYKVESTQIEKYLKKHFNNWLIENDSGTGAAPPVKKQEALILEEESILEDIASTRVETKQKPETYEGKVIKSFTFNRHTYKVSHWENLLTTLCDRIAEQHKKDFEKVLWISGDDKTYFSNYTEELKIPEKISKTDIYVETKLTADEIVSTARTLLAEFNYQQEKLKIAAE